MRKKKALTQIQAVLIIAIIVIGGIGIWYISRPTPTPPINKPPVIITSQQKTSAETGEPITVSAKGSMDPEGTIESYIWYFGDKTTDSGETVDHQYELPGFYLAYVEAVDDEGAKSTSLRTPIYLRIDRPAIEELSLDLPPIAIIGASTSLAKVGEQTTFDGASSYHYRERSGGIQPRTQNIASWTWDFGDGTSGEGKTVNHTYTEPGSYCALLTVKDSVVEKTDTVARTIVVTEERVETTGEIKNPDTIIMAVSVPSNLEIMRISENPDGRWVDLAISDTLLFYEPGSTEPTTEGGLAESYEMSSDGKTYTFHLRHGVKFWNGDELKAEDVVYTFRRSFKMLVGRSWGSMFVVAATGVDYGDPISDSVLEEHIYATDDYTVVFKIDEPFGPLLTSVAYMGRGIIQKKTAIEGGSWYMGDTREWTGEPDPLMEDIEGIIAGKVQCTGAYKIKEWSKSERILLERNEDYWKGPAPTKYILGMRIGEWSTKFLMLKQGDIDLTGRLKAENAEMIIHLPIEDQIDVSVVKYSGYVEIVYFGFNFDENIAPPENQVPGDFFNDVHMRRAFSYAMPYEKYIKEVWLGWPDRAKGALVPGWPGYYPNFPYEYDPVRAEEEFKLAHDGKYWDEGFTLSFCYQGSDNDLRMCELLQESLTEINPKFKVIPFWKGGWPAILDGGSPICPMRSENGPDPYYLTGVYHGDFGYAGYFGYHNEEANKLMEEASAQVDTEQMSQIFIEALKIIEEDVPGFLTIYSPSFVASKSYISGWVYNVAYMVPSGWVYTLEKK